MGRKTNSISCVAAENRKIKKKSQLEVFSGGPAVGHHSKVRNCQNWAGSDTIFFSKQVQDTLSHQLLVLFPFVQVECPVLSCFTAEIDCSLS